MCPLEANTFGIEFKAFCIQDFETKRMLFEIGGLPEDGAGAGAATGAAVRWTAPTHRHISGKHTHDMRG